MVYLQDGWFISWNPIQSYLEVSIQSDDRNHFIGWGIQLYGGFLKWAYPQYGWIRVEHAKIYHGWWLGLALFQETPTWDQMFPEMELHGERLRKSDFVHYFLVVLSVKKLWVYILRPQEMGMWHWNLGRPESEVPWFWGWNGHSRDIMSKERR